MKTTRIPMKEYNADPTAAIRKYLPADHSPTSWTYAGDLIIMDHDVDTSNKSEPSEVEPTPVGISDNDAGNSDTTPEPGLTPPTPETTKRPRRYK